MTFTKFGMIYVSATRRRYKEVSILYRVVCLSVNASLVNLENHSNDFRNISKKFKYILKYLYCSSPIEIEEPSI